ncbi:MAG TPA: quinol:electron acceptor oxidoreductase subunit ActD, partial [Salinimicrobium sp.]|nr:quinol:electron acceptor oxidoreductase subunit ActD [Salinimicrobium sp.]
VMFELTVFFSAHLMTLTFYLRSRLWPFKKAENPDERTTDDHFLMEVAVGNHDTKDLSDFLYNTGATEIKLIDNK